MFLTNSFFNNLNSHISSFIWTKKPPAETEFIKKTMEGRRQVFCCITHLYWVKDHDNLFSWVKLEQWIDAPCFGYWLGRGCIVLDGLGGLFTNTAVIGVKYNFLFDKKKVKPSYYLIGDVSKQFDRIQRWLPLERVIF